MPEKLHTTSSAARACDVPESYVRQLIARGVIRPRRDESRRAILSDQEIETIRRERQRSTRCRPAPAESAHRG